MQKTQFSHQEHDLRALIAQTAERFHATTVKVDTADGFIYQLIYNNADSWPYRATLWLEYKSTDEQLQLRMLPACAKPVETVDERRQALLFASEALANTPISLCIKSNEIRLLQTVPYPKVLLTTVEQMEHLIGQFGRYASDVVQAIDDRTFCLLKSKTQKPAPQLRFSPEQQATIRMLEQWLTDDIQEWEMRVYDATLRSYYFIGHLPKTRFALHFTIRPIFGADTYLKIEVTADRRVKADTLKTDSAVEEALERFNCQSPFRAKIHPITGRLTFSASLKENETTRGNIARLIDGLCNSTDANDICSLIRNHNPHPMTLQK